MDTDMDTALTADAEMEACLHLWGLTELIPIFHENGIDSEALKLLDDTSIREILPGKQQMGLRLKLMSNLKRYKVTFQEPTPLRLEVASTVSTTDTERELDDVFDAVSTKSLFESSAASTASLASSSESTCMEIANIFSSSQSHKDFGFMTSSPTSEPEAASSASKHTISKASSEMEPQAASDQQSCMSSSPVMVMPSLKRIKTSAKYDVLEILQTTKPGKEAIKHIHSVKAAKPRHIATITNMTVYFLMSKYNNKPTPENKEDMAQSIIHSFPCLKDPIGSGYETWYSPSSLGWSAKGSIEFRCKYLMGKDKETSDVKERKRQRKSTTPKSTSPKSDEPETPENEEELAEKTEWMRHNTEPIQQVQQYMKDTARSRRNFIKSGNSKEPAPNTEQVITKYPRLLDPGMVEQDYEMLYPNHNQLYTQWPALSACILKYAEITQPSAGSWKSDLRIPADISTISEDERLNVAFSALPYLFPGKKNQKRGARATVRETTEHFIELQPEGTSLEFYLGNFAGRTQPFILLLGGTRMSPRQTFVIIERRALPTNTLTKAVDLCYKIFQILHFEYAAQASAIWNFFDTVVFGMQLAKGNAESGAVRRFRAYYHFTRAV